MQTRIVAGPRAQQAPPVVISYPFPAVLLAAGCNANAVLQLIGTVLSLLSVCHSQLTASAEQNGPVSNCQGKLKQLCLLVLSPHDQMQHTVAVAELHYKARGQHAKKLILHTVTAAPALLHLYRMPAGKASSGPVTCSYSGVASHMCLAQVAWLEV